MKNKTVRPIMTVEARDALDKIHKTVKGETRSDSIEWFGIRYTDLLSQLELLRTDKSMLTRSVAHGNSLRAGMKREVSKYKSISIISTIACLMLIVKIATMPS